MDYQFAQKHGYEHQWLWRHLVKIVFAPLIVLWRLLQLPFVLAEEYISKLKEHGGYRGYKEWKKEKERKTKEWKLKCQADNEEYERITQAYKRKELRREELPRNLDGVRHFELYDNILDGDWRNLVYIENEYNKVFNDFFKRHPIIELRHDIRVVYLPQCVEELAKDEILRYFHPSPINEQVQFTGIDTSILLNEVCYPEDVSKLTHGIVSCSGWGYNHGAEYLHAKYFPLEEGDDDNIFQQIEKIAKTEFANNSGGLFCSVERLPIDKKPTKDFADEQFDWENEILLDEIRERVNKLEQRGIPRKLLIKLLSNERKLSRLVITKDMRIILPDYNNMEIKMEPINKAIFLLFLRYPKGIIFKHLPDYRKELAEIYRKIKPMGLNDRAIQSIEDVTNPCLNSINEKCARIRGAFISQFDDDLARHYYISGKRGEAKKIALPSDLITWEQ